MRRKREELVAQELSTAQAAKIRIVNKISDTKKTVSALIEDSKSYLKTSIKIDSLLISRNYIELLKRQLSALEIDLQAAEENISGVKLKLAEAVKQRKIIEKLKENQFAQYKKDYNKNDNAQMDEIANNKPRR
jgi:flagellar FliJ protein